VFFTLTIKMSIQKRYKSVLGRINSATEAYQISQVVSLLAVSKKQPIEKIIQLHALGQKLFGESYIQEAIVKIENLSHLDIQWHFIGPIQSNKTKFIAQYFSWVQSVDSIKLLTRLNIQRKDSQEKLNVLLQLKVGGEETKRGLSAQELLKISSTHADYKNLKIRGLMSIPAPTSDSAKQGEQFKICLNVFQQMQKILPVDTLSMGMSGDLESAITNGTTMVRIGTDLFGARDYSILESFA